MNLTPINDPVGYVPPKECVEWCIEQKVVNYNNLEIHVVMIVAMSLTFMTLYAVCLEYPKLQKYAPHMVFSARMCLYFFFYIYFIYVRGGV